MKLTRRLPTPGMKLTRRTKETASSRGRGWWTRARPALVASPGRRGTTSATPSTDVTTMVAATVAEDVAAAGERCVDVAAEAKEVVVVVAVEVEKEAVVARGVSGVVGVVLLLARDEGGVVSGEVAVVPAAVVPVAVEVVAHQVDKVEALHDGVDVVGLLHLVEADVDGAREDEVLRPEGGAHLGDEEGEVLAVGGAGALEEGGVLPVEVGAVEAELQAELDDRVDEGLALRRVGRHRREVPRASGPSTD